MSKEERTELLKAEFKDDEIDNIQKSCESFPNYDVKYN